MMLALVAGCGGGEEARLSRADYVAQANKICRDSDAEIARLARAEAERIEAPVSKAERERLQLVVLEKATPIARRHIDRLGALKPPEEDEDRLRPMVDRLREATDLFGRFAAALRSDDEQELMRLTRRFGAIASDTRRVVQEYGLTDCLPENGQI